MTAVDKPFKSHVSGVDSLRFLCALWVLLGHAGGVPLEDILGILHGPTKLLGLIRSLNGIAFDGVAAVIVFFIISGFCIHLPFRDAKANPITFFVRRILRIGVPVLGAIGCAYVITGRVDSLTPVLWSLYCELIYYALYPLLSLIAARTSWAFLLACSVAPALSLAIQHEPNGGFFWSYGPALTWILGLPVWLSGVVIADRINLSPRQSSRPRLWPIRSAVWICSVLAVALQFHSSLHYKITMLAFCPLAAAWFVAEVANALLGHVSPVLEAAGQGSYSLYLCHLIALNAVASMRWPALTTYLISIVSACCLAAVFYFLIEKPAHQFAKWASKSASSGAVFGEPSRSV